MILSIDISQPFTKAPVPLGRTCSPIVHDRDKFSNLKPIGMMKMNYVTIYPNIYECVSDYLKIHPDRF